MASFVFFYVKHLRFKFSNSSFFCRNVHVHQILLVNIIIFEYNKYILYIISQSFVGKIMGVVFRRLCIHLKSIVLSFILKEHKLYAFHVNILLIICPAID